MGHSTVNMFLTPIPDYLLSKLYFPDNAVHATTLPLRGVFEEMSKAHLVIVSLGDETGCISALDAHAAGRPVISGNDIVFKAANPEGTGIRVFSAQQRFDAVITLLNNSDLSNEMGRCGYQYISDNFLEIQSA